MSGSRSTPRIDDPEQRLVDRAMGWVPDRSEGSSRPHVIERLAGADDGEFGGFERAAAALHVAFAAADQAGFPPIPAELRHRLEHDAAQWLASTGRSGAATSAHSDGIATTATNMIATSAVPKILPWLVTAASLMLACALWVLTSRDGAVQTPESARRALLREADTVTVAWDDPLGRGVMGDVVWNQRTQQGVLHVVGLPENDPKRLQYQLWIFDAERESYSEFIAVDGGVFDVTCPDAVVAIDPKLDVGDVTLFAITSEPPGGVVKHNPERDPARFRIELTAAMPE